MLVLRLGREDCTGKTASADSRLSILYGPRLGGRGESTEEGGGGGQTGSRSDSDLTICKFVELVGIEIIKTYPVQIQGK